MTEECAPTVTLGTLLAKIERYHPGSDTEVVRRAFAFAEKAHAGQLRRSGEPYFTHPCAVAVILADIMLDSTTIAAALLHDCVEDVEGVTIDMIAEQFGPEIRVLVDGVTKLSRLDFTSREEQQAESIRKMFLAMAKDIRVVLIKLADRLHNMRTLRFQPPDRQIAIARETIDIYAPLAHRLGMYTIKSELEDLSLLYLDPAAYHDLENRIGMEKDSREELIADATRQLSAALEKNGLKAEISGRAKHYYSIYRKMQRKHKTFDQIDDLTALRVIVDTQQDCYFALGIVHTLWPQVPGKFKDYISVPKGNMYQSLHTVVEDGGRPFEVQIRTHEMHRTAEYGIAAHWLYKEGRQADALDDKLSWLRRILDWQSDTNDPSDFSEMLKTDLFSDEVFVFTPRGDIVTLPRGATPLDFAYSIHSEVGHHCIGAKVNKRIVSLSSELNTGDFVEVMTSSSSHGPSRDWLNIVKTGEAKSKIRSFLKKESRDENVASGRDAVEREAKKLGVPLSRLTQSECVEPLLKRYSFQALDDVYAAIGFGGISTAQVVNRLMEEYRKLDKAPAEAGEPAVQKDAPVRPSARGSSSNGVRVKGESGLLVRFARCCTPLPGDEIVGYITRGRGVSVHRADCRTLSDPSTEPARLVEVEWEGGSSEGYDADIRIFAYDRNGLMAELSVYLANSDIPLVAINAHSSRAARTCTIDLTISVHDAQQLEHTIRDLSRKQGVIDVKRVRQ